MPGPLGEHDSLWSIEGNRSVGTWRKGTWVTEYFLSTGYFWQLASSKIVRQASAFVSVQERSGVQREESCSWGLGQHRWNAQTATQLIILLAWGQPRLLLILQAISDKRNGKAPNLFWVSASPRNPNKKSLLPLHKQKSMQSLKGVMVNHQCQLDDWTYKHHGDTPLCVKGLKKKRRPALNMGETIPWTERPWTEL